MAHVLAIILAAVLLAACQTRPPYEPPPRPRTPAPLPSEPEALPAPQPPPAPPPPTQPPPKQFRLSSASAALVAQAHAQAAGGETALAVATIERALRIEPDNPLLWIELGEVNQAEGRYAQAYSMARKALQLAAGDPRAQAAAWRLIADSLRARGRNQEASEAEQRARELSLR